MEEGKKDMEIILKEKKELKVNDELTLEEVHQHDGHVCLESKQLFQIPFNMITDACSTGDKNFELISISLKRNRLSIVGVELYAFTTLRILDLSRNRIHTISPGISQLVKLEQLILLSNRLKLSSIPVEELLDMPCLELIDFRYNEKLEKQQAISKIRNLFGARALVGDSTKENRTSARVESASDRDGDILRDQLAPWSTPQLRQRLFDVFGIDTNPEMIGRDSVLDLLLQQYALDGPRRVVQAQGKPVHPNLVTELTNCLRNLAWPTTTRERPKVQAFKYFTLQRPNTKFTAENGTKAKLNAAKLEKYAEVWNLLNQTLASVDPEYAESYTGVALTYGFKDSPHIDTENIGPFYAISLGNFEGGGCIAVESGPKEVTHVTTFNRLAKVDGRFPHWVTKYSGERYSIIFYRTVGAVTPITKAVLC